MITLVGNLKGGTGKSTAAFNLALWLAARGDKVTVCDLDPQATLRDVLELRGDEGYEPQLKNERDLPDRATGEVIVDVGTSDMIGVHEGIKRAHQIIIPVAPSQADVWATQRFIELVKKHAGRKKPRMRAFINRADPHPLSHENRETLEALQSLPQIEFLSSRLTQRMVFRRSFSEGLGVFELEPSGKGAKELNALGKEIFS
ncbi:AAA family ATPase [Magnetospira sp. QH-2]|uniref:nucleotide-binding protein n=1 Tax=Magnetospira sp. (strain QH-2) TaxID=1288970 RepID=UPI0003E8114E|nr:AAA family ATPase [Magnetospira sp. QH-2]CCQ75180.1 putative Cobyrinic acid a,c-diamide synthase [Magnetospira sp. QH-2]